MREKQEKKLHLEIITQTLTLTTSAFGVVAALAWNSVVQTFIEDFIKPFLPQNGSAILSLLIYALVVTVLAVSLTLYLSRVKEHLETKA